MGKGFNNYMCKKFFHPASRDNLKRVWMAEQKAESYKKKQEELRQQYEKEQDLYTNKAILSNESKDKLSVNFMYEPPPGTKKEREREDDEPEYKFEWQRKFNAPREDYCKGDSEIRDQPFGIQVRNVRCIKCHKWGHINTDKECPMYCRSITTEQLATSYDPMTLVQQMRDDSLAMKRSALASQQHTRFPANQKLLESSDNEERSVEESEANFLKSLSKEQKYRLLKKLNRLEKGNKQGEKKCKTKKKLKIRKEHSSENDYEERVQKKRRSKEEDIATEYDKQVRGKKAEQRREDSRKEKFRLSDSICEERSHRVCSSSNKSRHHQSSSRGHERLSHYKDRMSRH